MAFLAVDDELGAAGLALLVAFMDFALQAKDDGAGRVDDRDAVSPGGLVGGGRFAMRPEEDLLPSQRGELVVLDGAEAQALEAFDFQAVVYDVAQAIERVGRGQLALGAFDRRDDAETEPRAFINLNFDHRLHILYIRYRENR